MTFEALEKELSKTRARVIELVGERDDANAAKLAFAAENDTLKAENVELQARIETLCAESGDINEHPVVVHLQNQNTELAEQNVALTNEVEARKTSMGNKRKRIKSLKVEIETKTLDHAAMRDARDHMEGKYNDCNAEKQSLKKRYNAVQIERKRLQQWNDELEKANQTLQREVKSAELGRDNLDSILNKVADLGIHKGVLRQNAELLEQVTKLETENKVNEGLAQRNTELAGQNAELEKERDKWRRQHNYMCERNTENWDARVQLEKRGAKRAEELEGYKEAAKNVEEEHQKHLAEKEAEIERLQIELNGALFQQNNLKAEVKSLKLNATVEPGDMDAQIEDLKHAAEKAERKADKWWKRVQELEEADKDNDASWRRTIARLQDERDTLKKQLATEETKSAKLAQHIVDLIGERDNLKAERDELKPLVSAANEEKERHQKQKLEVLPQLQAAEQARDAAVEKAKSQEAGLLAANTAITKLQSEVDRLGEENKKIDRYSESNHAYQKIIEKLRDDLRDANAINTNLMKDKARLVKEVAKLSEAQPVSDTEARLRKENDELSEEAHILMAACKQLLQERETYKLQFGDVCSTNDELRTQVKDLQALCDTLADVKKEKSDA